MNKYYQLIFRIVAVALLLIPITSSAQLWKRSRAEIFFAGGATNFLGELGGADDYGTDGFQDLDFPSTRYAFQFGYSYKFTKGTFLQLEMGYAMLSGDDAETSVDMNNPGAGLFRLNRNLHFRSHVYQFDAKYMINLTKQKPGHIYKLRGIRGLRNVQIISYVFAGVGCFYYEPQAKYLDEEWYNLHDKNTEGQTLLPSRKKYHRFQPTIPIGFGFKWQVARDWLVGVEVTMHKTFTDYLDDVSLTYPNIDHLEEQRGSIAAYFSDPSEPLIDPRSGLPMTSTGPGLQRGDPTDNDAYMFAVISLRYKIPYSRHFLGYPKF